MCVTRSVSRCCVQVVVLTPAATLGVCLHLSLSGPPALAFPQLTDDGQKYITTYSSSNVLGKLQNIRCLTPYFECRQCSRLPDYDVSRLLSRVTSKPRSVTGVDP